MKKGFTVVEILLVIAMLSVIALLFISYTGDVGNVSADAASWKIQADIRHAQQLANETGVHHGVQFMQSGNYTVYKGNAMTPVLDPLSGKPMVVNPVQFGNVWIGNGFQVEFDKMGRPILGGGGSVEIIAESGAKRRIHVVKDSGAVIVDILGYGSGCSCRMRGI
ncbi:MAG: prepilin-type N-terminal cleavage/methylation domain-containing protein [Pseudomonadota bacterium]